MKKQKKNDLWRCLCLLYWYLLKENSLVWFEFKLGSDLPDMSVEGFERINCFQDSWAKTKGSDGTEWFENGTNSS